MAIGRAALAALLLSAAGVATGCGAKTHDRATLESRLRELYASTGPKDAAAFDRVKEELVASAPGDLDALVGLLAEGDPKVAAGAEWILNQTDCSRAIPRLQAIARGSQPTARYWATSLLILSNPIDSRVVDVLADGVESTEPRMRIDAVHLLAMVIPPGEVRATPRLLTALAQALKNLSINGFAMGGLAAQALRSLGAPAVPVLVAALNDADTAWWAIGALGDIGPAAKDAIPALEELVKREYPAHRSVSDKAGHALERIRGS